MTKFICQELLYEFATGNLDLERQMALDAHLTDCRESQRELEKLKAGFQYTSRMAKVGVSPELRAALLGFEPLWKKRFQAWTLWWSTHGWRALPYAVVTTVIVLTVLVMKPWTLLNQKQIVLHEAAKLQTESPPPPDDVKVETTGTTPLVNTSESEASTRAVLFRGEMQIGNFAEVWPKVREKIVALGGQPAGQEELGAERENGSSYFHFSLPESNQTELENYLKTFGPVQFKQEAHPRVMPEGEIHIILTLKDGGTNGSREKTETP